MAVKGITRENRGERMTVPNGCSFDVESGGEIDVESGGALKIAGTDYVTGVTAGTITASKVVVVDTNKDITGFRQITCSVNGTVGIALTGTYTSTAVQLGTSSAALTLTAYDDHIVDIYSTCASTDGSNSVRPIYMKSTMTGAGGVGGRAEFHLYTDVTLGGWSNIIKGLAEYGSSGRTTGLGSAICAEIQLSAGTSSGTYAPIEVEIKANAGCSTGTATGFIYCNGEDASGLLNDNGYFLILGSTLAAGAGHMLDSTIDTNTPQIDHSIKILTSEGIGYIPVMDNANGS